MVTAVFLIGIAPQGNLAHAQISPVVPTNANDLADMLPDLIKADTLDKVLSLFKPAPTKSQLINSDYLFLDSPPIAATGIMSIHMMSELPGTEFFLLFNSTPAVGEPSFLTAQGIPNLKKADVRVKVKLSKSTELTMIVRAGGRWYSVTNDVKIVTK